MSQLMTDLKVSDSRQRGELINLFNFLQNALDKLDSEDDKIQQQLQKEDSTMNYNEKIDRFKTVLHRDECPVVIAGEKVFIVK